MPSSSLLKTVVLFCTAKRARNFPVLSEYLRLAITPGNTVTHLIFALPKPFFEHFQPPKIFLQNVWVDVIQWIYYLEFVTFNFHFTLVGKFNYSFCLDSNFILEKAQLVFQNIRNL